MRLLIKQRVFSWTDTYDVYDENEIGMIKQRVFTLLPCFDIEIGGREMGSIQKEFTFFKPRYEIDYNGWRCEGDFMNWNYDVYAACSVVIHISKELFHWGDTYVLDIMNPQDEIPALMLAVAIDAANCSQGN